MESDDSIVQDLESFGKRFIKIAMEKLRILLRKISKFP